MISNVASNLEAMSPERYVLAFVFICSYAYAISEFIGERGRRIAVLAAAASAIAFALLSDPWEHGVMVVTLALIGMGLFTAIAWSMWTLASWRAAQVAAQEAAQPRDTAVATPARRAARPWMARLRIAMRSS